MSPLFPLVLQILVSFFLFTVLERHPWSAPTLLDQREDLKSSEEEQDLFSTFIRQIHTMSLGVPSIKTVPTRPAPISRTQSYVVNGHPTPPATAPSLSSGEANSVIDAVLELADGTAFRGISFGAETKSVSGECVFQTGACLNKTSTCKRV